MLVESDSEGSVILRVYRNPQAFTQPDTTGVSLHISSTPYLDVGDACNELEHPTDRTSLS